MRKKKKKKTKRSQVQYPGLTPNVNPKSRWELLDHDYLDKLTDEEKRFLSNFNEEYLSGNFNHEGKRLHRTKKEKRECYGRNNSRNRDIFSKFRTHGWSDASDQIIMAQTTDSPEDALIELIDSKNSDNTDKDKKS